MILLVADPILSRHCFAEGKETPSIAHKVQPQPRSQLQLLVQGFGEHKLGPIFNTSARRKLFEAQNPKRLGTEVPLAPVGYEMLPCAGGPSA